MRPEAPGGGGGLSCSARAYTAPGTGRRATSADSSGGAIAGSSHVKPGAELKPWVAIRSAAASRAASHTREAAAGLGDRRLVQRRRPIAFVAKSNAGFVGSQGYLHLHMSGCSRDEATRRPSGRAREAARRRLEPPVARLPT